MKTIRTIDVKGLEHEEKEKLIFPNLEELNISEDLNIIFDFDPVPLTYMLKARQEFEIKYEKKGPPEWILNIIRISTSEFDGDKKKAFKKLIQEIKEDGSDELKEEAKKIFQGLDAKSLALMEQDLIREGVSHDEIRESLCDIHLEVIRDALVEKRIDVTSPHPIHTFMEEHKVIVESLENLTVLLEKLKTKTSFDEMGTDIEGFKEIAHHLVEAESHHQREEDVLFPQINKHEITEPTEIMKLDHVEFLKKKKSLYNFTYNWQDFSFDEYKNNVLELGQFLAKELESHIFKEDNILYQIALQVLTEEEWGEVKRECDKIGYCCFAPEDPEQAAQDHGKIVDLDLRPLPPFERHEKIFRIWAGRKPGETLKITNDHDPKPLWYQFEVEYKGKFEWEYEQEGPKDWIVKIKRL